MANIDVQIACSEDWDSLPSEEDIAYWAETALPDPQQDAEMCIRIVEEEESQQLNNQYRGKNKPTNVLSFPSEIPEEVDLPLLGDLVICVNVVERESKEQNKSLESHWAHMVLHGTLHLLGYDHIEDKEAEEMEHLETQLLVGLGYPPPY